MFFGHFELNFHKANPFSIQKSLLFPLVTTIVSSYKLIMKNSIYTLLAILFLSCSTFKYTPTDKHVSIKRHHLPEFKIVNTPLPIINSDSTIYVNELRFFRIRSAMDGMKLMYENYGSWDKKIHGTHQKNMHRIIYENVKLIDNIDEEFTVIASGAESTTDYFACLMVFDTAGKDCFKATHPYREQLTKILVEKMRNINHNSSEYRLFR